MAKSKLQKCMKILDDARRSISAGNSEKAKELYGLSREIYLLLEYHERKEVYHELNELYSRLKMH